MKRCIFHKWRYDTDEHRTCTRCGRHERVYEYPRRWITVNCKTYHDGIIRLSENNDRRARLDKRKARIILKARKKCPHFNHEDDKYGKAD